MKEDVIYLIWRKENWQVFYNEIDMYTTVFGADELSKLQKWIESPDYCNIRPKNHLSKINYAPNSNVDLVHDVLNELNSRGYCVIRFPHDISLDLLASWQQDFLGPLYERKNPKGLRYSRVAIKLWSKYLADSQRSQGLHTDEGYTNIVPKFVSLYCKEPAKTGGTSTLALIDNFISAYSEDELHAYRAFNKEAMQITSPHGTASKPLLFYYGEEHIGVAYTPIVQEMKIHSDLKPFFDKLTEYLHKPENQIRINLNEGDLLIFDNFKVLHGRTKFDIDSKRTLYRFWFDAKDILNVDGY